MAVDKAKKYDSLKKALRGTHLVIGTSAGSRRTLPSQWIGLEDLGPLVRKHVAAKKSVALLFGSERSGLSNDDLSFCHYVLKIPTVADCPSMNLSQAVAVVACAIRSESGAAPALKNTEMVDPIPVSHLERLVAQGVKAATAADLLRRWADDQSATRFRKMLYRWNPTPVDAALLHGLFGWVLKKKGKI